MLFEQSLPVAFGAETAKWICVGAIDITQISVAGTSFLSIFNIYISLNIFFIRWYYVEICSSIFNNELVVAGYLLGAGKPYYALALLALIIPQVVFQVKHLEWFSTTEFFTRLLLAMTSIKPLCLL